MDNFSLALPDRVTIQFNVQAETLLKVKGGHYKQLHQEYMHKPGLSHVNQDTRLPYSLRITSNINIANLTKLNSRVSKNLDIILKLPLTFKDLYYTTVRLKQKVKFSGPIV